VSQEADNCIPPLYLLLPRAVLTCSHPPGWLHATCISSTSWCRVPKHSCLLRTPEDTRQTLPTSDSATSPADHISLLSSPTNPRQTQLARLQIHPHADWHSCLPDPYQPHLCPEPLQTLRENLGLHLCLCTAVPSDTENNPVGTPTGLPNTTLSHWPSTCCHPDPPDVTLALLGFPILCCQLAQSPSSPFLLHSTPWPRCSLDMPGGIRVFVHAVFLPGMSPWPSPSTLSS
jgi:hypothetical protein